MTLNSSCPQAIKQEGVTSFENNTLIINCKNCSTYNNNLYQDKCISCLFFHVFKNKKRKINKINLKSFKVEIPKNIVVFILEYHSYVENISELFGKIIKLKKECLYTDFNCRIIDDSILNLEKKKSHYNPIFLYQILQKYTLKVKQKTVGFNCINCYNELSQILNDLLGLISNIPLIRKFKNFKKKRNLYKDFSNFYEYLLSNSLSESVEDLASNLYIEGGKLIERYNIGNDELYAISIYQMNQEIEHRYKVEPFYKYTPDKDFFKKVISFTHNKIELIKINRVLSLERLIVSYKNKAIKIIDQNFNLTPLNKKRLGLLVALKIMNLEKIFPLLLDDNIEEIFLDSPLDFVYLNHQKYIRCRTLIKFTKEETERIKTLLRLYSGIRLDRANPSLQYVIKNKFFYCRFAIDVSPINFNGFSLDIRKLNKNVFTIQDLIKNKTLNPRMAAFFYFCVLNRFNFTVTGETDSGKTTLINSLDFITPKEFRKIYVENVVESLNEINYQKHQLKFKVHSFTNGDNMEFTKTGQIKTLLHRSPDIIFLGEILTKQESEAMFHCLAAGLKGFQTIHANNISSLINRFIYHFKIKKPCLNDLDLIIMMKKGRTGKRRIISVAEVSFENKNGIKLNSIFKYNPNSEIWDLKFPLYETKIIQKIQDYENLSKEKFESIIDLYTRFFNLLSTVKRINSDRLISLFDKISFFSKSSLDVLKTYVNGIDIST